MARIYLDWAASAPPVAELAETASQIALRTYGNPSSSHEEGREAEKILTGARRRLANALGVPEESIVFTSGGTEANNIVLTSLLSRNPAAGTAPGGIVAAAIEHSSIYEPLLLLESLGHPVTWIPARGDGRIDPERVASALTPETLLVTVMHVNNETGAIQPIEEIARSIRSFEHRTGGRRLHFHCDGVQSLGKVPADWAEAGVDSASFSAHKLGGLRGAGALYLRRRMPVLFRGGGQESDRRPGTENLPAIWAMAEAAGRARERLDEHTATALRNRRLLVERIRQIDGARFIPAQAEHDEACYSPYILSAAFPPLPGEVLVRTLNDAGCAVSTGSACSSKRRKERRVLKNMGISEESALSAIRISTGYETGVEEIERFCEILRKEVRRWNVPLRA